LLQTNEPETPVLPALFDVDPLGKPENFTLEDLGRGDDLAFHGISYARAHRDNLFSDTQMTLQET